MELAAGWISLRRQLRLSRRVPILSESGRRLFARERAFAGRLIARPSTRTTLWLLAALVLGIAADLLSTERAQIEWLRKHPPGEHAWTHALGARGFRAVTDPRAAERVRAGLPAEVEARKVFVDSSWNWIVLAEPLEAGTDAQPSRVLCRDCFANPGAWTPWNPHWLGFEALISELDRHPAIPRATRAPTRPRRDPREITY